MLNLGIVGCGYWGPNLIRNFHNLGDCRVKKICDVDAKRLSHLKSLYPQVETTSEYNDVINDAGIDAVVMATPVHSHFDIAHKCLRAGKHTFIEKPMASSSEQCKRLIEIAEAKNLTLMVGHTFIYSTPVNRIKEIIDSGELGQLLYISSQRLNLGLFQKDINVVWDLAPHDISIILYIVKEKLESVSCQGKAHVNPKIEDVTSMTLNFENNVFSVIQSSWLDPNKVRQMKFVGSKKMLVYDDIEPNEKIKIYDRSVEAPPYYDTFAEFQYSYHYGDMCAPYLKLVEPLKVECQHFLDCIKHGTKCLSSGQEGFQVVKVLESATESLKKDGIKVSVTI